MKVQDATPERLGPYRLIRRLGEGGMGVVYLAADAAARPVAVKALRPAMAAEENARRRLAREVETMQRVRSQYVAEVVDADVNSDPPYIVTRYVPGLTLDAIVGEGGPLTGTALARLACGLAQALTAVHAAGVVHRDLKPGNVMIADGEPVVIDFGIAQLPETTRLTMTGMFMGTPGYLAPEVIEGKASGTASDVHSLGATLAFAATGRPPFGTGTFETIFFRIMHGQPDLDTVPAPLRSLVLRSLSRDPASRPSAAELSRWAASLDPATLVPSPAAPGANGSRGGRLAAGAGAVGHTMADQPGLDAWPTTRPLGTASTGDLHDLLPPVRYSAVGQAALAGRTGLASPVRPAGAAGPAAGPGGFGPQPAGSRQPGSDRAWDGAPGRSPAARSVRQVSSGSPLIIATVAVVVAVAVLAPIAGTVIALAALVALRAASLTGRQLARRRSGDGRRAGDPLLVAAFYPVAVLRSLISLVLLAPVGLLGFGVAAAITIIAVPVHPLPPALAFGAGTLVAIVGLGPGSGGSRATLARFYGSVASTPSRMLVAYVGVIALAAWAGLTAFSQPAAYWPVSSLHTQLQQLPTVDSVLRDARLNLLMLARRFGL